MCVVVGPGVPDKLDLDMPPTENMEANYIVISSQFPHKSILMNSVSDPN